ncbi:hypothetical protein [Paracoccus tegillarcae]|uniref:hypothetical protein n=1 Tax=Paracoccus tegillarcae TaxID=1529068 RepID=UPI0013001F3E|nr:hypothetical protein [Paracoccus tegillarcae]
MSPWPIALACLLGAIFIAGWCSMRRLWWPYMVLAVLTAVIALQLFYAFRGHAGYHDLSALTAMKATVMPALVGTAIGTLAGERLGTGLNWRSWQGAVALIALAVALGAVVRALLI